MLTIAGSITQSRMRASLILMAIAVAMPAGGDVIAPGAEHPRLQASDPRGAWSGASGEPLRADLSPEQLDVLARLVAAEAAGESYLGQVAVAAVVLNRIDSPLFPGDLDAVIYQPRQFEPVGNGTISRPATRTAVAAVDEAVKGHDPTRGALFFFNPYKADSPFLWARPVTVWIGSHRFSR